MITQKAEITPLPENYRPSWKYGESIALWSNRRWYYAYVGQYPNTYLLHVFSDEKNAWQWEIKTGPYRINGKFHRERTVKKSVGTYDAPDVAKLAAVQALRNVLVKAGLA